MWYVDERLLRVDMNDMMRWDGGWELGVVVCLLGEIGNREI